MTSGEEWAQPGSPAALPQCCWKVRSQRKGEAISAPRSETVPRVPLAIPKRKRNFERGIKVRTVCFDREEQLFKKSNEKEEHVQRSKHALKRNPQMCQYTIIYSEHGEML